MIEISKDAGARVLLLGMQLPARFGLRYSYQFGKLYINVADDHNIHMVSLLLRQVALNSTEENSDTLLVNKNGQEVIFESVWPFLVPLLNAAEMDRLEE
jgi:acyl-CoA thioesterase-1